MVVLLSSTAPESAYCLLSLTPDLSSACSIHIQPAISTAHLTIFAHFTALQSNIYTCSSTWSWWLFSKDWRIQEIHSHHKLIPSTQGLKSTFLTTSRRQNKTLSLCCLSEQQNLLATCCRLHTHNPALKICIEGWNIFFPAFLLCWREIWTNYLHLRGSISAVEVARVPLQQYRVQQYRTFKIKQAWIASGPP